MKKAKHENPEHSVSCRCPSASAYSVRYVLRPARADRLARAATNLLRQIDMADTATSAPAAAATPKKSKSAAASKKPRTKPIHPPTADMVNAAIKNLKERGGSSLQAIKKYIAANYKVDAEKLAPFIRKYLKSAVASGKLTQPKGKGASGSFKLSVKTEGGKPAAAGGATAKKAAKRASKPKGEKKPKAAGTPKKAAKKPGAAAKKAKSPSKAKKVSKPPTKKPKSPKPKKAAVKKPKTPKKSAAKKK